jgi:hypothetical protein
MMAVLAVSASATEQDVAPTTGPANPGDGSFPILFTIPMDQNAYCVGVGFDGTNLWVSAGDQETGVCEFYIYDEYGTLLDNVPQGGGATSWGHRDMCWNGSYMFGSYSNLVDAFGPDYQFAGYYIGCLNPNRAMAYNGTDFFTCGFGEQLTRMEWDGNFGSVATCNYLGAWDGAYGLAYDYMDDCLYMSTADYTGNLWKLSMDGFLLDSYTCLPEYDIAGGCTMACTMQYGYILVVLQQFSPDTLVFYDLGHGPSPTETGSWGAIKAMYR